MNTQSLMQCALGEHWAHLPPALQAHYQRGNNADTGALDIEYPRLMQPGLNLMRRLGALVNRRGQAVATTVKKRMEGEVQHWERTLRFADGEEIQFKSSMIYAGGNSLIEFVNPLLGLKMAVRLQADQLHYEGQHYVLKLGRMLVPIPEWLVLGHTTIVETALDEQHFVMDFCLQHPLLGRLYRYTGKFRIHGDAAH